MDGNSEGSSESGSLLSCNSSGRRNITDLPWEVLHEIFCYLDGKSLLNCKRVSISWRDHVHYMEQNNPKLWYNNCQKEIPSHVELDLLDNMYPSHFRDEDQVDFEEIFKSWDFWNSLNYEAPVKIYELGSGLKGVTNMKVSGEWLLITSYEFTGKLMAKRLTGPDLVEMYKGGGLIENFELVNSDIHPPPNADPKAQIEEIFDSLEHNQIWLELKSSYIQLGRTFCHSVDKVKQQIRHSYGYQMRLVNRRNHSSITLKKICSAVHGPETMEIELNSPYSGILEFWMYWISFYGKFGKEVTVETWWVNHRAREAMLSLNLEFLTENDISDSYIWNGCLCVIYTHKRKILIQKDGVNKLQVTPFKKGLITSVLFYANYFFLGTDRGHLLIYKVKSPEECLEIEVYTTPAWTIQVCQKRINHIAVVEAIHHKNKGPVILCATPEEIHIVSLSA